MTPEPTPEPWRDEQQMEEQHRTSRAIPARPLDEGSDQT